MKKYLGFILLLSLFLSGCGIQDNGVFHQSLVQPFIEIIKFFAGFMGNSYGMGIIAVTLLVRFIVMPVMLKSFHRQKKMQYKMKKIKPEVDIINKKIKHAKTQEEKMSYSKELTDLYRQNEVNPMSLGCLPILIQMPILMALYFAIAHNADIASQNFMWFNLGTSDIWITLIAGGMYAIQSLLSLKYVPKSEEPDNEMVNQLQSQMKIMTFISPVMIVIAGFNMPAALPLYWATGALVLILQQYLSNKYFNYSE